MRITFINQFYWPDRSGASRLLTDVTRHLASIGHDVTVITGNSSRNLDVSSPPPGRIVRIRSLKRRALSYGYFLVVALWKALLLPRQDVVVTLTTPPFISLAGNLLRLLRRTTHIVWEMDLYPDVAVDVGVLSEKSFVTRVLTWMADASRRRADAVLALGPCMRNRLALKGLAPDRLHVVESWADGTLIRPVPRSGNAMVRVLYSGNVGLAHDIETLCSAMRELRDEDSVRLVVVGSGPRKPEFQRLCAQFRLNNIIFEEFVPSDQLQSLLADCDIGVVSLRARCLGSVVPSKAYEYMAAAKPILLVGPAGTSIGVTIRQHGCGWQVDNGEGHTLADLLRRLVRDRSLITKAGEAAYRTFLHEYDLPAGVARVTRVVASGRVS